MKMQTATDFIGNSTTPATLTAAFAGNRTNKLSVERADELNLEVQYTPGANNQYIELLIETSSDGTNWKKYPAHLISTTENQVYDIPIVIPGDKVSTASTAENFGATVELNHIWIRVSVRERTNAGADPSTFGTIWINGIIKYDVA